MEPKKFDFLTNISNNDILKQSVKDEPKTNVEVQAKEQALKSMKYLLGISEKYSHFFQNKIKSTFNTENCALNNNDENKENQTDPGLILDEIKYFNGNLRPYQSNGVIWLRTLFENAMNGILADEMGLGKTVQIIALICNLIEKGIHGPFLVIAPLSTLPNWEKEFSRFAKKIPVVVFQGYADERKTIKQELSNNYYIDNLQVKPVILTSYNMILLEENYLAKFSWKYIIVDEGHRLKNSQSKLFQTLITFKTLNKVLLTGTPIQNNLTELWCLLNFLMPQIFNKIETFSSLFALNDLKDKQKFIKEEEENNIISTIHKVLAPFMLRRLKKDVMNELVPKKEVVLYCPLSKIQLELYIKALNNKDVPYNEIIEPLHKKRRITKTSSQLKSSNAEKRRQLTKEIEEKDVIKYYDISKYQNSIMMYKKIVNHPYLVRFPIKPGTKSEMLITEELVKESGKMMVLDAMLPKLQKQGHRVLIFCTLVIMLDLIEEYMILRGYKYRRLDGKMSLQFRGDSIQDFTSDPEIFVFLISTRAGGLGLNLVTADTVILFDRDWNPQVDSQAQDRCHRIGQTKPVAVYTLITKNTIDERILKYGNMKKRLEKIVIKDGEYKHFNETIKKESQLDLLELQKILDSKDDSEIVPNNGLFYSDAELDKLLDRTDLFEQMKNNKIEN